MVEKTLATTLVAVVETTNTTKYHNMQYINRMKFKDKRTSSVNSDSSLVN